MRSTDFSMIIHLSSFRYCCWCLKLQLVWLHTHLQLVPACCRILIMVRVSSGQESGYSLTLHWVPYLTHLIWSQRCGRPGGFWTNTFHFNGHQRLLQNSGCPWDRFWIQSWIQNLATNRTVQVLTWLYSLWTELKQRLTLTSCICLFHYTKMSFSVCQCNCGEQNALVQHLCFCNLMWRSFLQWKLVFLASAWTALETLLCSRCKTMVFRNF